MIVRSRRCLLVGFVPLVSFVVTAKSTAVATAAAAAVAYLSVRLGDRTIDDAHRPLRLVRSGVVSCAATKRNEGLSSSTPSSDADEDDANQQEKRRNRANKKFGELMSAVTSVLPFTSGSSSDEVINEPGEKRDSEGGLFSPWFRRRNDEKRTDTSNPLPPSKPLFLSGFGLGENFDTRKQSKNTANKSTKQSTSQSGTKGSKGPARSEESNDNSVLRQMQGLFPFNSPPKDRSDTEKLPVKEGAGDPLSALQKFFSFPRVSNIDPFIKKADKEDWYPVFPKTRIMPGEIKPVTIKGLDLLVVASTDNRSLYCIANSCPHLGTPLETGRLTRLPTEDKPQTVPETTSSATTTTTSSKADLTAIFFSETDVSNMLSRDGCEDCIVCPLHHTAFALKSGEVRGEWCPYPPVLGALLGTVKPKTSAAVFDVRTRGKNVEVRLNSVLLDPSDPKQQNEKSVS